MHANKRLRAKLLESMTWWDAFERAFVARLQGFQESVGYADGYLDDKYVSFESGALQYELDYDDDDH